MLLDRCVITTSFRVNSEVFADRVTFNEKYGTEILESDRRSRQVDGHDRKTSKLAFGSYGGIEVFAVEISPGWWEARQIYVNPRKILYRHNGKGLSVEETLIAFSFLREEVACILSDPNDVIHILPGLHSRSRAYWVTLELAIDLRDREEILGRVFRNAHYPRMSEGARYRNGNVQIGSRGAPLKITIYRKDKQMQKLLHKHQVTGTPPVFRVEVTLAGGKLLEKLGKQRNVQEIGGRPRLVRFTAADLIECHRGIVTRLQGCFKASSPGHEVTKKNRLPRFMAHMAHRYEIPITDIFNLYESEICCGDRTSTRHHGAARKALEDINPLRLEEVFSEAAYYNQPAIEIKALEKMVNNRRMHRISPSDVEAAYGERRVPSKSPPE